MGILGGNRFFSADYGTSRHRFRRLADQAGAIQESVPFDGVGPDGESLADCLCEMQNAPVCDARKELLALARRKSERDAARKGQQ